MQTRVELSKPIESYIKHIYTYSIILLPFFLLIAITHAVAHDRTFHQNKDKPMAKQRGKNWITGPDPLLHEMYVAFGYHRVSSRTRNQKWAMSWQEWRDIWLPHWNQRGRGSCDLCMARRDWEKPWSVHNVELITRRKHSQRIRKEYS